MPEFTDTQKEQFKRKQRFLVPVFLAASLYKETMIFGKLCGDVEKTSLCSRRRTGKSKNKGKKERKKERKKEGKEEQSEQT